MLLLRTPLAPEAMFAKSEGIVQKLSHWKYHIDIFKRSLWTVNDNMQVSWMM